MFLLHEKVHLKVNSGKIRLEWDRSRKEMAVVWSLQDFYTRGGGLFKIHNVNSVAFYLR